MDISVPELDEFLDAEWIDFIRSFDGDDIPDWDTPKAHAAQAPVQVAASLKNPLKRRAEDVTICYQASKRFHNGQSGTIE